MVNRNNLNVLVCPLGWGLGHASRDIPIINQLLRQGHSVYVAGDKPQLDYLKQFFPDLRTIHFPSLKVNYTRFSTQFFSLLLVALRLPFFNIWEHYRLKKIVTEYSIDLVISDNRYGLWSRQVKSVIVTHQVRVIPPFPFKWTQRLIELSTKHWLKRFDQVWIPDYSNGRSIAGFLSKQNGLKNLHYIGILSRFSDVSIDGIFGGFELVVIASGPEPQRSIFADLSAQLAQKLNLSCLIIEGKIDNGIIPRNANGVWHVGHLPDLQFALALKHSNYLIARGGYSTIMDLITLGVSGLLVPTPGQTEQEYLAEYLSQKGLFPFVEQHNLLNVDKKNMEVEGMKNISTADDALEKVISALYPF